MTTTIAHNNKERQLRRTLNKLGYSIHKSRQPICINNLGGYMIVWNECKACVAGENYSLSLEDVEAWLDEMEE